MKRIMTDLWWLLVYAFVGILVVMGISLGLMTLGNLTLSLHLVQWTQTLLLMIVPAVLWVKLHKRERVAGVMRMQWPGWRPMVWTLVLMAVSLPMVSWLEDAGTIACERLLPDAVNEWARQMLEEQEATIGVLLALDGFWGWLELIMLMCIGTAVGEEMMFRGAVLRCFLPAGGEEGKPVTKGQWIGAAVWVGLIFSVCHGDLYGLIPRWVLGSAFVWLVYQTRSIWPGVLAHALNNTCALIEMKEEPAWMESLDRGWVVLVSLVLTALIVSAWRRQKPTR